MPIFDQGYQHWQGKLSGHAWRWLTITRQGVRTQAKNRVARLVILFAWIPALLLVAFLAAWGLLEQKSNLSVLQSIPLLPEAVKADPTHYRAAIWTVAYHTFFEVELFFCMILVLLVGPGLISKDLRFNAMPLYFSKPLRRFDYFAGKLGVIAVYVGAVAISPALIAYVLGIAFSLDLSVIKDTLRILAASLAYGLVIVLSVGTLMLALSSLSRKSLYVGAMWLGLWLISSAVSTALTQALWSDWCPLISYTGNLEHIGSTLLDKRRAVDQLTTESNQSGATPLGMIPPQRARAARLEASRQAQRQPQTAELTEPNPPWYWSAAVLAGLFGLSLCILTSRVKSLDRLK